MDMVEFLQPPAEEPPLNSLLCEVERCGSCTGDDCFSITRQ